MVGISLIQNQQKHVCLFFFVECPFGEFYFAKLAPWLQPRIFFRMEKKFLNSFPINQKLVYNIPRFWSLLYFNLLHNQFLSS